MQEKIRVYMAGPLFTFGERAFNLQLKAALQARLPDRVQLVLPQEEADALLPDLDAVVADCFTQIVNAAVVIANLDGPDADAGTAVEVGFARGLGRPVIGYRSDFRGNEVDGVNAMLRFGCSKYLQLPSYSTSLEDLANALSREIQLFA